MHYHGETMMKKIGSIFLMVLLTVSYQVTASQSYNKLMDLVRKNMSTVRNVPHDLTEHGATVLFSKEDVFEDKAEILQLSDEVSKLYASLTEQERAKLPRILMAAPGTYAMKFYVSYGCWRPKRFITTERPTEEDLDRHMRDVKFV